MNKILVIANEYTIPISNAMTDSFICVDGTFNLKDFKNTIKRNTNMAEVKLVIVDNTAFDRDFLEVIKWIRDSLNQAAKLVVLYPNLTNASSKKQLSSLGVNNIVCPIFNKGINDDEEIDTIITNELKWALENSSNHLVDTDEEEFDVKAENELLTKQLSIQQDDLTSQGTKLRVLGFYSDNDSTLKALNATEQYNFINILYAKEEALNQYDLNNIDLIICDRVPVDFLGYLNSIISTNINKTMIVAGYKNSKEAQNSMAITNVNVFTYKDNGSFIRQVSVNLNKNTNFEISKGGCQIIGVYGVKGGVGATTLSNILAKEYLATHPGKKVLAIDYTTQTGSLGIKFGIEKPTPNIFECALSFLKAKAEYINLEIIKSKVLNYIHLDEDSGVYVIPSGFGSVFKYCNYQFSASDTAFIYEYILNKLYAFFDVIFIDVDKNCSFTYDLALKSVDKLILVSDSTLPSVSQLQIKLSELNENEYAKKYYVILNRTDIHRNGRDLDNSNTIKSLISKNNMFYLPVDDYLYKEVIEMGTKYKKSFRDNVRKIIESIEQIGD